MNNLIAKALLHDSIPRLIGIRDAATISGLSEWTWRSWIRQGKVTSYKLGSRVMIELTDVQSLIEQGKRLAQT